MGDENKEDRWDYDIKISDGDNDKDITNDDQDDLLSAAIDSKMKQHKSLVDVLMDGPQKIIDQKTESQNDETKSDTEDDHEVKEEIKSAERWDYDIKLSD